MADMGLGGLFGAAGSIGGAFIAADAQKYAANTNWAIALMNYYKSEREREEAKQEAHRLEIKRDLGSKDIEGTVNKFIPGVGLVAELSDVNKALQGRMKAEQLAKLGPDAQQARYQRERNTLRQLREEDYSKALFDQMRKTPSIRASSIEGLLNEAAMTGVNRGFDETQAQAMKQAMRTKTAHPGAILSDLAVKRGRALGDIAKQSRSTAYTMAPQLNQQEDKTGANLYNLFATRAAAVPGETQQPQQIANNDALLSAMRGSQAGGSDLLGVLSKEGGRLPYVPPLYGTANAIGAVGAAGRAFANDLSYGSRDYYDDRQRGNQGSGF